jgi:hypothetical protein
LRELSDVLLHAWHDWAPRDVPALARALSSNPGGMVAARLGSLIGRRLSKFRTDQGLLEAPLDIETDLVEFPVAAAVGAADRV